MVFIFDMGGVLARDFDIIPEAARLMGMDEVLVRRHAEPHMKALMSGTIAPDEYWNLFGQATGVYPPEDYWATLFRPTVDTEVEHAIRMLRGRFRVVCGTNTVQSHYMYLQANGMYDCFDAVYASHLYGVCKPDPEFWHAILRAEEIGPEDAIFIDDMKENIDAAEKLGIKSHLFQDVASFESWLNLAVQG